MKKKILRVKQKRIIRYKRFIMSLLDKRKPKTNIKDSRDSTILELKNGVQLPLFEEALTRGQLEDLAIMILNDVVAVMGDNQAVTKELTESFIENNLILLKSIYTDTEKAFTKIFHDALNEGHSIATIRANISKAKGISKTRAETIAITETANLNSVLARKMAKEKGISKAVWSASADKRTRPCHKDRDQKEYDLSKGCYSACDGRFIQVGQEVRCRCAMVLIFP